LAGSGWFKMCETGSCVWTIHGTTNVKGIAMEIGDCHEFLLRSLQRGSNHHVWKSKQRKRDVGHLELGMIEACNHLNLLGSIRGINGHDFMGGQKNEVASGF